LTSGIGEIRDRILPLLVRHGVRRAAVFGSRARGDDRPDSDLDLLVEFEEDRSLLDLVGLRLDVQELLGLDADVVTYNSLRLEFREKVLDEQVAIL
jgi:hypothetical protein